MAINHKVKHLNRRKAIRKKCVDCSAGSYKEVEVCEFTDCPLHPYRSGQGAQNAKARSKAIRRYCLWCVCDQQGEMWNCPSYDCTLWPYRKSKTERIENTISLPKTLHIEALQEDESASEHTSSG